MLLALLIGCAGVNVNAIPTQDLWIDDGEVRKENGVVQFAVVGDVRPFMPGDQAKGRTATPDTEAAVVRDISDAVQREDVDFVVLLGDLVRTSTTGDWKRFAKAWSLVLSGSELPETGTLRTRVVPVAGNHDRYGDTWLKGFGAAFPNVGADIGFNRVATWYAFDIQAGKGTWRFVVVDSDKNALGSRWSEQMEWLPKALDGDYDGLLVFMHHPRWTLAKGETSDQGGGPTELLDVVETETKVGVLRAVFAGHAHTNEVYLPGGKLGEMFVVAGGGGSPANSLPRWGRVGEQDLKLEPIFDLALVRELDKWMEAKEYPETVREQARATGSWQGFTGEFDARYYPIQGWWNVALDGKDMSLTFRMVGPDGKLKDLYTVVNDDREGWKIGS